MECYKSIHESELAAADPNVPLITCCKCLGNTCCVTGCDKKYISKYDCYRKKILFEPYCELHIGTTYQCRHSIDCHNKVANGVFCNIHRCTGMLQDKTRCQAERMPGKTLCPVHAFQCVPEVGILRRPLTQYFDHKQNLPKVEKDTKNSRYAWKKIQKDSDKQKHISIKRPVQEITKDEYMAPQP
jgi:hypothetical protein